MSSFFSHHHPFQVLLHKCPTGPPGETVHYDAPQPSGGVRPVSATVVWLQGHSASTGLSYQERPRGAAQKEGEEVGERGGAARSASVALVAWSFLPVLLRLVVVCFIFWA